MYPVFSQYLLINIYLKNHIIIFETRFTGFCATGLLINPAQFDREVNINI